MNQIKKYCAVALAVMLVPIVGCGSTPMLRAPVAKQGGTAQYVADSLLSKKVKAALIDDSQLSGNEIQVHTFSSVVQLSGDVHSDGAIDQAVRIARNVAGVTMVTNDMHSK